MKPSARTWCRRVLIVSAIGVLALLPVLMRRTSAQSSGPVAAFAFSEGNGTTTADSSGNGNTGTLQGATAWTAGYFGNAIAISGAYGTGVQVPMNSSLASITTSY